jgi:hypothetical protein
MDQKIPFHNRVRNACDRLGNIFFHEEFDAIIEVEEELLVIEEFLLWWEELEEKKCHQKHHGHEATGFTFTIQAKEATTQ